VTALSITKALAGQWQGHYGVVRCPVHGDRHPSLKVRDDPRKADGIDVHCFAGCNWKHVKAALVHLGLIDANGIFGPIKVVHVGDDAENEAKRQALALGIWAMSAPIPGTLGAIYFKQARKLDLTPLGDLHHALRWNQNLGAVIALMTDPITGGPSGIHRTYLNADGTKRDRRMLGRQGVVRLSPDEDVTYGLGIAEGVEDALAILLDHWKPVWAATSAGAIGRFPILNGVETLNIFADNDTAGLRAAELCADRWIAATAEALIIRI